MSVILIIDFLNILNTIFLFIYRSHDNTISLSRYLFVNNHNNLDNHKHHSKLITIIIILQVGTFNKKKIRDLYSLRQQVLCEFDSCEKYYAFFY